MTGSAVSARGLTKKFGSVQAVAGIDLDVPSGACFGLIGENGAGKTTFIKMMLGICRPDAGTVHVLGADPDAVSARKQIGYLPERIAIPEAFSPLRFLASVARHRGLPDSTAKDEAIRVLELVELDKAAWKRNTGGFSKGMKQRTGLAAALLGKPRLLVLDEPTDGIDPLGRAQIRGVIEQVVRDGTTVFLNSHLLAETEKICNHVAVLAHGRVVKSGALDVLKRKDAYRAKFVKATDDVAKLGALGFNAIEEREDDRVYKFEGNSPTALSNALKQALDQGFVVVEVSAELKDLETILKEAVRP